ncbi:hypothetical protein D3C79_1038090 [compost metagenome]
MAINIPRNRLRVSENWRISTSLTMCISPSTIISTVVGVTQIKQITASRPGNSDLMPLMRPSSIPIKNTAPILRKFSVA